MLAGLRAVIFDLDGTLLDRHASFELFARDQWSRFALGNHPEVDVAGAIEADGIVDAVGDLVRIFED